MSEILSRIHSPADLHQLSDAELQELTQEMRDELGRTDNRCVAVIGDGALPSGIVFEALNNAGGLGKNLLVILNDNKMSICPRVGGLAQCLDKARLTSLYQDSKRHLHSFLSRVPLLGGMANQAMHQVKDGLKAF